MSDSAGGLMSDSVCGLMSDSVGGLMIYSAGGFVFCRHCVWSLVLRDLFPSGRIHIALSTAEVKTA